MKSRKCFTLCINTMNIPEVTEQVVTGKKTAQSHKQQPNMLTVIQMEKPLFSE